MKKQLIPCMLILALIACSETPHFPTLASLSSEAESRIQEIYTKYGVRLTRLREGDTRLPWYTLFTTSYKTVENPNNPQNQLQYPAPPPFDYPILEAPTNETGYFDKSGPIEEYPASQSYSARDNFEKNFITENLINEFKKYPKDFFRKNKIHDLFFVEELKAGFLFLQFDVYGIGFNFNNEKTVILTTNSPLDVRYSTSALHHELFHVFDEALIWGEKTWEACTPSAEEKQKFKDPSSTEYHPEAGFVSLYATSIFREDKAEVFRMIMSGGELSQYLNYWISEGDSALKCKQEWMFDYLKKRFPELNERYFKFLNLGLKGQQLYDAVDKPQQVKGLSITEIENDPEASLFSSLSAPPPPWTPPPIKMPLGIGELKHLEKLSLSFNLWHELSEDFTQLKHLKSLSIQGQNFSSMPQGIFKLSSLESLKYLDQIKDIPPQIAELKSLKKLLLKVESGSDFSPLKQMALEELELHPAEYTFGTENGINITSEIKELKGLKKLTLKGINNTSFEVPFAWKSLLSLHLEFDVLQTPIQDLEQLIILEELTLNLKHDFPLKSLYQTLQEMPALKRINIQLGYSPNTGQLEDLQSAPPQSLLDLPRLTYFAFNKWNPHTSKERQAQMNHFLSICREKDIECTSF